MHYRLYHYIRFLRSFFVLYNNARYLPILRTKFRFSIMLAAEKPFHPSDHEYKAGELQIISMLIEQQKSMSSSFPVSFVLTPSLHLSLER